MKKTITGVLESINEQLKEIRKTHDYKILKDSSEIKGNKGEKRNWLTFELELKEK